MGLKYEIAKDLLDIKAVQIKTEGYFTWTSGIQSPIYCDNRLTMSYPSIRHKITSAFIEQIDKMDVKPDVIAGCATAGIPHAAWLASELNLPMIYVRSSAKGHGKGNQIEGQVNKGQKVLMIEDLISTGGSSINAAKALIDEDIEVLSVLAIFTYGIDKTTKQFVKEDIPLYTITSFDELLDILVQEDTIKSEARTRLLSWRNEL